MSAPTRAELAEIRAKTDMLGEVTLGDVWWLLDELAAADAREERIKMLVDDHARCPDSCGGISNDILAIIGDKP